MGPTTVRSYISADPQKLQRIPMLAHYFHLTFLFPSPKPTTHQQLNWSRALCWSAPSAWDIHCFVHRFLFPVRPKVSPSICWILFWYFLFFPCSSIFCVVFTETLAHLVVNACLFMPLFLLKYSFYASFFVFIFWF